VNRRGILIPAAPEAKTAVRPIGCKPTGSTTFPSSDSLERLLLGSRRHHAYAEKGRPTIFGTLVIKMLGQKIGPPRG